MLYRLGACAAVGFVLAAAAPIARAGEGADASAPSVPQPAEIMPNASKSLVLGLAAAGDHLVAVGARGDILLSDNGNDWKQVAVPVRSALTAVDFVDAQDGWAVGHDAAILHSSDGGATWTLQNFQPDLEKPFLGVLFLDKQRGFAVGAYGLFNRTVDGGAHWTAVDAPAILADGLHLYSIRKLGNGDLFIAGEQGLLGRSADGGQTWTKLDSGYKGTFFGAAPVGSSGVLVCGLRGNAYYAADVAAAAVAWQKIDTGATDSFFGCAPLADGRVVMAGVNGIVSVFDPKTLKVSKVDDPVDIALSAVLPWKGGFVVGGEAGVRELADSAH